MADMTEWRDISTAPRDEDGPYLLLGGDWTIFVGRYVNMLGKDEWWPVMGDCGMNPTHWMPLPPSPPSADTEKP